MELPLVWLMLLSIILWQMELPLWLIVIANMADGIAICVYRLEYTDVIAYVADVIATESI